MNGIEMRPVVTYAASSNVSADEELHIAILEGLKVSFTLVWLTVAMQTHAGVRVASVVCSST